MVRVGLGLRLWLALLLELMQCRVGVTVGVLRLAPVPNIMYYYVILCNIM